MTTLIDRAFVRNLSNLEVAQMGFKYWNLSQYTGEDLLKINANHVRWESFIGKGYDDYLFKIAVRDQNVPLFVATYDKKTKYFKILDSKYSCIDFIVHFELYDFYKYHPDEKYVVQFAFLSGDKDLILSLNWQQYQYLIPAFPDLFKKIFSWDVKLDYHSINLAINKLGNLKQLMILDTYYPVHGMLSVNRECQEYIIKSRNRH